MCIFNRALDAADVLQNFDAGPGYQAEHAQIGIEKAATSETIAWVALATSVVSLLTALIGLAQKFLELRKG